MSTYAKHMHICCKSQQQMDGHSHTALVSVHTHLLALWIMLWGSCTLRWTLALSLKYLYRWPNSRINH